MFTLLLLHPENQRPDKQSEGNVAQSTVSNIEGQNILLCETVPHNNYTSPQQQSFPVVFSFASKTLNTFLLGISLGFKPMPTQFQQLINHTEHTKKLHHKKQVIKEVYTRRGRAAFISQNSTRKSFNQCKLRMLRTGVR